MSKTRLKGGEDDEGGSAQTDRGSGDDCDDEDGCEASGKETGESHTNKNGRANIDTHTVH